MNIADYGDNYLLHVCEEDECMNRTKILNTRNYFYVLIFLIHLTFIIPTSTAISYGHKLCASVMVFPSMQKVFMSDGIYFILLDIWGSRVVRWCWVTFQCRGVLQF